MAVFYGIIAQQLVSVGIFSLFFLTCWYYWSHRKILRTARSLPSVHPSFPLLGHGYLIFYGFHWMINYGVKLIKEQLLSGSHDKGVFWVGPYPIFLITDPEEAHIILNSSKSFEGGIENQFLGYALGNGLITAPVKVWKVTRRHVNAMFHPRNIEQLLPVLNSVARELTTSLVQKTNAGLVDVEPLVYPIALKSTCKLIFGPEADVNMESDKFKNLMDAITRISQLAAERFVKVYLWPNPIFKILCRKTIKEIEDGCDGFIIETLQACRKQKQTKSTALKQKDDEQAEVPDMAETLTLEDTYKNLQENYPDFTEKDLHLEMRTILLGGSESTRITLSSCLIALAANPDIQERLYLEIVSATGTHDSDVTIEDLRAMPYLDQVLKETLRKFLVIPLVTRRVQEDLSLNGWTIPSGSLVGVLTFGSHFNPKYFPDPERFDPDRFSPENVEARARYTFMPFSSGPRNCIGKNYSMIVLKTLLVHTLKRFKFSTTVNIDCQPLVGGVITGFRDGYRVLIEGRGKDRSRTLQVPEEGQERPFRPSFTLLQGRSRDKFID